MVYDVLKFAVGPAVSVVDYNKIYSTGNGSSQPNTGTVQEGEIYTLPNSVLLLTDPNNNAYFGIERRDKRGRYWYYDAENHIYHAGTYSFNVPAGSLICLVIDRNTPRSLHLAHFTGIGTELFAFLNGIAIRPNGATYNYTEYNGEYNGRRIMTNNLTQSPVIQFRCNVGRTGARDLWWPFMDLGNPNYIDFSDLLTYIEEVDPDPNSNHGNSEPGGGGGTRPGPSSHSQSSHSGDSIPIEVIDKDAVNSGFITIFTPTKSQIQDLASFLWTRSLADLDPIRKLLADPMDVIIGLHVLPIVCTVSGSKEIKPGLLSSGVTANYTDKQFITKNMGSITLEEYFGGCLDYAPYSRVSIYLPFIGMRTLDTDLVMGKTLSLSYTIEVTTGELVAQLAIDGNVMYQFSGNCAMQIPVSGNDYRNAIQAAIGLAATIGAGIASGGSAAAPVAAATGVTEAAAGAGVTAATVASIGAATANAVLNQKPSIEKMGSLGGVAGYMGIQKPYIMVEYPRQCLPKNYMKYNGYPAYMTATFGTLTGYTQCETVRFKSGRATDEERKEIVQFLQSGVILGGTPPTKPTALSAGIGLTGYQNASEDLVVNKSLLNTFATQSVYLKKDTEITRPTIILSADTINFNYAYIDAFDRFYYVTGVRNIGADRWEVDLKVDSLTSFSGDISNSSGVISRQENEWNLYIDDGTFKVYQDLNTYTKNFPGVFNTSSYVLLVAGS